MSVTIKKENLVKIAAEMNEVMNAGINLKSDDKTLLRFIRANSYEIETANIYGKTGIVFTPETVKLMVDLELKLPKAPALTPAEKEAAKKAKETEKALAAARKAAGNYSRSHALYDALRHGGTKDEVIKLADDLYFKHHADKERPAVNNVSRDMFQFATPLAVINGSVTVINGIYKDTPTHLLEIAIDEANVENAQRNAKPETP